MSRPHLASAICAYACSGETRTWLDVVDIGILLRGLFPGAAMSLPKTCADGSTQQPCLLLKNGKIRDELGIEFTPLAETLKAQGNALTRAGLLQL